MSTDLRALLEQARQQGDYTALLEQIPYAKLIGICLLYTSDAADE